MLIGAIVAHLGDFIWGIYSQKNILIKKKVYYFVKFMLKTFHKYVIFKFFQIHLQVLLLVQNNGYMDITLLLKVQMLMKSFFILEFRKIRY
jgi:hypothetical protein